MSITQNKQDIYEWFCFLFGGTIISFIIYAIVSVFTTAVFVPVFVRVPLNLIGVVTLLYLYKKFMKMYKKDVHICSSLINNIQSGIFSWCIVGVIFCIYLGCLYAEGYYRIESLQFEYSYLIDAFAFFLFVGVAEEIIFRGVIFRLISDRWNFGFALIVSSSIFGLLHFFNDNATIWSAFSIAISSGVLFGVTYEYYGTIWVPIFIHWAWNFIEGPIIGCAVSGYQGASTIIKPIISGNELLTGGKFGPEASVIVTGLVLVVSLIYFWKLHDTKTGFI